MYGLRRSARLASRDPSVTAAAPPRHLPIADGEAVHAYTASGATA